MSKLDIIRIDNAEQFKKMFPHSYGSCYITQKHEVFFPNKSKISFPLFITIRFNSADEATMYGSYSYIETTEEAIRQQYEMSKKHYKELFEQYESLLNYEKAGK